MDKGKIAGYEIQAKLGEGGMGVVYRALDATLDRLVAVKVVRAEILGAQGKARFLREARACSHINHPNIVTVYAAGEDEGRPYMAMEYLEGRTLSVFHLNMASLFSGSGAPIPGLTRRC